MRVYAIADIHGRIDLLDQVCMRIDRDLDKNPAPRALQIFLGDYIDRGPASREVLDRLIERGRHHDAVFLKGNHEEVLLAFLEDPEVLDFWRQYGGLETLISYGLRPSLRASPGENAELAAALKKVLPESHFHFLQALQPSFTCGDFFFVHAGVNPEMPCTEQSEDDLLWIRDDFLQHEGDFGKVVVHGHTPVEKPDIRFNRINIDTGAYATGRLSCLVIEGDACRLI